MMLVMTSIRTLFKDLYKTCVCGCNILISIIDKKGRPRNYKLGHHTKGINNYHWKGLTNHTQGYNNLSKPGYFSSYKDGRVLEHVYIYQEYYKCCMLPWGVIHHIDRNRKNNDINNLQGMMRRDHQSLHSKKDTSDRFCSNPKCNTTYKIIRWFRDENGGWECYRCHRKRKYKEKRLLMK
jgi:hypothetical protein